MTKKQNGTVSKYKKVVISAVLIILAGISVFVYFMFRKSDTIKPLPQAQSFPVDTENDGVYTNYQYGFKFKYPNKFFVKQTNSLVNIGWYNQADAETPFDLRENGIWMSLSIASPINNRSNFDGLTNNFDSIFSMKVGDTTQYGVTKLRSVKGRNYKQIIFFSKTPESKTSEHSVSYVSEWIVDNKNYLSLYFSAGENKEGLLRKYKITFDQIVNSFEFFDTSNASVN